MMVVFPSATGIATASQESVPEAVPAAPLEVCQATFVTPATPEAAPLSEMVAALV